MLVWLALGTALAQNVDAPAASPTSDEPVSTETPTPSTDATPSAAVDEGGLVFEDGAASPDGLSFEDGMSTTSTASDAPAIIESGDDDGRAKFSFGGYGQYDLRFRPIVKDFGPWYADQPDPPFLARNDFMIKVRGKVSHKKYGAQVDVDFAARAIPKPKGLDDLSAYNSVSPFRVELHDLYVYARDLFGAKGLDVKIGQQKALFGVGDQFNPTNNVNANDLEDILLFGDQLGNAMIRADYSPLWNLTFTGILVPVFKPALLPNTGYLAQTPDRYPFVDPQLRYNLAAEQAAGDQLFGYPTIVRSVALEMPELSAKNMQAFARIGGQLGGQDIAISYYNGFSDIPQPIRNTTTQVQAPACQDGSDPASPPEGVACIDGVLASDVTLTWPKMQVLGFNMSGEMNPFGKIHKSFKAIGYRIEVAVIFPQEVRLDVTQDNIKFGPITKDGPYPYPTDGDNRVVPNTPFAKWTLGLDYQFNRHLYMNTQWVHGMVDEFGAGDWITKGWQVRASGVRSDLESIGSCLDLITFSGKGETCAEEWLKPRLGDYLVWGTDVRFAAQRGLLRIFTLWDVVGVWKSGYDAEKGERTLTHYSMFTPEGFSAVIYPSLSWNFGQGFQLEGGALVQLGQPYSKFGAAETGGSLIWTRARYSF